MSTSNNAPATVWRESASLIVCAKSQEKVNECDYKILMLKRSDQTALFNNQVVFPGGIYDPYDESVDWLKYFEEFGVTQQSLKELIVLDNGETERPKILQPQGNGCYDRFFKKSKIWAREISLRINAIRETFEETGIFLCRNRQQLNSSSKEAFCMTEYDTEKWQKAVHNDPKEFLNMCKQLQVVPDLWGLFEWCAWASPAIIKKGYETVFFITFLNKVPEVLCEETEVKESLWLPPKKYLEMLHDDQIFFLPPQVYETTRLSCCPCYNDLKDFAWHRSKKGTTMFRSIAHICEDGMVIVFPGDDYYMGDTSLPTTPVKLDWSIEEFRVRSKNINRMENPGTPDVKVFCNIKLFNDHLVPVIDDTVVSKSKL